jgi:predicted exporter/lauroyl/myristoyl acyltransferase
MKFRPRHWLWVALLLLLPGLFRLRLDVDVLNLLPANIPAVQGLKLHQKYFANANELIITIEAADADAAERAARSVAVQLRQHPELVRGVIWQPPWMENPAQSAELIAYLWLNQAPEKFRELTNRLSEASAPAVLRETRERLATTFSPSELARLPHDPFDLMQVPDALSGTDERDLFSSSDGTFRLVFVQAASPLKNYRECQEWLVKVRNAIHVRETEMNFTGGPAFSAEIAGSMEGDMRTSVLGTMAVVALMFWLAHRRWRPLLWLVVLLAVILLGTFALAGWVLGTLNVISAGFAGILLGLADYGVVMYQEWRAHPEKSAEQIRREVAPSIFLSALATGGAFLLLNLSGLPGLGQLGTLVGLGIGLAAIVMVYLYLPPLTRIGAGGVGTRPGTLKRELQLLAWLSTAALLVAAGVLPVLGLPPVDDSSEPLRPRKSRAYAALEEIKQKMGERDEPLWLIIRGRTESEVQQRMQTIEPVLDRFVEVGKLKGFELPRPIWPIPANQETNRAPAQWLSRQEARLKASAVEAGFTGESLSMTEQILRNWANGSVAPTNFASRWLLDKVIARTPQEAIALGSAEPVRAQERLVAELSSALAPEGVLVAGWERLGPGLLAVVRKELPVVLAPVMLLVAIALWWAFRRIREIALSLASVCMGGVGLLTVMRIAGWEWNLMNLLALPLLLGAGVDYSIHMLSSLRRNGGNLNETLRTTGRALLLCGGTTVVGFGSLAWSSNAGLASLGKVCATGIGGVLLISVYLLPFWWKRVAGANIDEPSSLYRAGLWLIGMHTVRLLPNAVSLRLGKLLANLYCALVPARREVVISNLQPIVGDRKAAERSARELFQQFSLKLIDLWRFESGQPVKTLFSELIGWEHFTAAQKRGKGVLMVTPHLGNWEFGGPLLIERGIKLHVVTLIEPGAGFTELRQQFRARWGIETLVIGHDMFAVVEVIKRLQDGATVALLVDRPPPSSAVPVQLFGRPFKASVAAAELARASGCAVLPVVLPRTEKGYIARVLPEIPYDRAALGKREAREAFTAEMVRAFEPEIRQYLSQWYHFVPVWPKE